MGKSVLIMDTPENCTECRFAIARLVGNPRCHVNEDSGNSVPDEGRPDWCPLQPLDETTQKAGG